MEILHPDAILEAQVERTFRASRIVTGIVFVLCAAWPLIPIAFCASWFLSVHWAVQLLLSPFLLMGALMWLMISSTMWQCLIGSLRTSNWCMKVGANGIYLNIRCYSNYHLARQDATVVHIPFTEIDATNRLTEQLETDLESGVRCQNHLELRLNHADTDALRQAIRAEAELKPPTTSFLGIKMSGRATRAAILLTAPDTLRVSWTGGAMLRTLRPHLDDRLLALLERGDEIGAVHLLRDARSMTLTEAKEFLAGLRQPVAE